MVKQCPPISYIFLNTYKKKKSDTFDKSPVLTKIIKLGKSLKDLKKKKDVG